MNIFYHLTILPPKLPQAEAVSKEVATLSEHFGGDTVWVNPNRRFFYTPRLLFGLHHLNRLRTQEREVWGHHIFNPDPFPFPY
ncbi:MAG: hypothetical protein R3264_01555, partial [Anaerolineae bacterium]|nr:hypothetical protein [Anaerolineae bacterium]